MRGSVRILFIWMGKDDVGGGTICRITGRDGIAGDRTDGYSVLFGSDPGAIPRNHNRWGYARELAWWNPEQSEAPLVKTVFEGFMSKSSEESMDEIRSDKGGQEEEGSTLFEGSISEVIPEKAYMHLWRFEATDQATYQNPEIVASGFRESRKTDSPDVERTLENENQKYGQPAGFFTAIRLLLDPILEEFDAGSSISHFRNARQRYVNSAHLYTLQLKKLKLHREYSVDGYTVPDVLELDFQTLRHDLNREHDFSLWIPASGDYRGIPVKIEDKPRWWLKVELEIDFAKTANLSIDG